MGHFSDEETDISESELDDYISKVYKQLKKGEYRVKASTSYFKCPFCAAKKKQEYLYHDLFQHARGMGKSYRSENLRQKGNHLALVDYLDRYHRPRMSSKSSEKSESHARHDKYEKLVDYPVKNDGSRRSSRPSGKSESHARHDIYEKSVDYPDKCDGRGVSSKPSEKGGRHARLDKSENLVDYSNKYKHPTISSKPSEKRESHTEHDRNEKLVDYSDKDCSLSMSSKPSEKSESHVRHDKNEKFVWPWKGIIANIPVQKKGNKYVGESGSKLRDELARKGFNPLKVIPLWTHQGHSGYAAVNFNKDFVGFGNAMSFEKWFASDSHGKLDWHRERSRGDKLYGWLAREDDYYSSGIIGNHLRDNGDLKSIADLEFEDKQKTESLVTSLTKTIEDKKIQSKEMENKLQQTSASLSKLLQEKDVMIQGFNDEIKRMQEKTLKDTKSILIDHEKFKKILESQKEKLERHEKELEKREADYDNKIVKLRRLRKMNESASLEQKKADENVRALVEKHKVEKEELHRKIIDLQKQIDQRQALELQIEQLKGAAHVMEHMGRDVETQKRMDAIKEELMEKEEELEDLEQLTQALIVKERKCNDELQEARKELINGLRPSRAIRATVGVRNMGILEEKAFEIAAKAKYPAEEAPSKAEEMISLWVKYIEDPDWHPFKIIRENGTDKAVINEEDERLKSLRNDLGDEAYLAVTKVLSELNEYNPSGRYPVPELWSFKADRKATLKEGAEYILNLWRVNKRKRH